MTKKILLLFVLFINLQLLAQKLTTTSYGSVLDENKSILKPEQVKTILYNYPEQLKDYSDGNKKKKLGNIFIIAGAGLIFTDLVISLTKDKSFPKMLSAIGIGSIAVGVPIKLGYSKKIKNAIDGYNNNKKIGYHEKLEITANNAGLGLKLSFN